MAVQSAGTVLAVGQSKLVILIGADYLGAAKGNLLMFHPLLLADAFGVKDYPRIYGMGQLIMILGVGSGPFLVGLIRDASSYCRAWSAHCFRSCRAHILACRGQTDDPRNCNS